MVLVPQSTPYFWSHSQSQAPSSNHRKQMSDWPRVPASVLNPSKRVFSFSKCEALSIRASRVSYCCRISIYFRVWIWMIFDRTRWSLFKFCLTMPPYFVKFYSPAKLLQGTKFQKSVFSRRTSTSIILFTAKACYLLSSRDENLKSSSFDRKFWDQVRQKTWRFGAFAEIIFIVVGRIVIKVYGIFLAKISTLECERLSSVLDWFVRFVCLRVRVRPCAGSWTACR